jgi:hypothetical protein
MGKRLIVIVLAASVVMSFAAPAFAKGPFGEEAVNVTGTVKMDGPGLRVPLVLGSNGGSCGILDPCQDFAEFNRQGDFLQFATDVGVTGYIPPYARGYYTPPPASKLGPAYQLHWTFVADNGKRSEIVQTLYPYAPDGRAWVHTAPGQKVFGFRSLDFEWISAPTTLSGLLQGYGLPKTAPVAALAAQAAVTTAPASSSHVWLWTTVVAALMLLIIAGVVSGRRRSPLRTA